MANQIHIDLDTSGIARYFARLIEGTTDLTPLMRAISQTLVDETLENFDVSGRPAWADLSDSTKAKRTKQGTWPGQILVQSARLRNSITGEFDLDSAQAGTNVDYAPYLQFGTSKMPARPYLPVVGGGGSASGGDVALQPETEKAVDETIVRWLTRLDAVSS